MNNKLDDINKYLPLQEIQFKILTVLVGSELNGYEIKKEIEQQMNQSIPAATIYRHIRIMLENKLIEAAEARTENSSDSHRDYYRMTDLGQKVYKEKVFHLSVETRKSHHRHDSK